MWSDGIRALPCCSHLDGEELYRRAICGVLQAMVEQTSALDRRLAGGDWIVERPGVDIHDAMIATQKADMAFQLALEVRNKAVGAYQQMMGMQF